MRRGSKAKGQQHEGKDKRVSTYDIELKISETIPHRIENVSIFLNSLIFPSRTTKQRSKTFFLVFCRSL